MLRQVALAELQLLQQALNKSATVYVDLDRLQEPAREAERLSDAAGRAVLPITRAVAAEHMGYLYNRAASTARTADLAESFYSAAVACSHYAYVTGNARHAKYIAQNLLEIARSRMDSFLRQCAETVWVDGYVIPYHLGLHSARTRAFEDVDWIKPIYLSDPTFAYEDIPPYSVDPAFVYEGPAAPSASRHRSELHAGPLGGCDPRDSAIQGSGESGGISGVRRGVADLHA